MNQLWAWSSELNWPSIGWTVARVVLILIGIRVLMGLMKRALNRFQKRLVRESREPGTAGEDAKRAETLIRLLRQASIITIWVVGLLVILSQIGVAVGPLLASAGILGLAVGFGAQNLVRDVISGFFIILENQVRVGDVAVVNGTGGMVEEINLRTIVLRDISGVVHVFPNGTITTLSNMTLQWSAYVMDIGVAYKEDVDDVIAVMKAVAADLRADEKFGKLILEDIEVFGLDKFADSSLIIKARLKTFPIKQWEVGREYNRRLKKAFDTRGIEIPFPHRSIYFGNTSKPVMVQLPASDAQPLPSP